MQKAYSHSAIELIDKLNFKQLEFLYDVKISFKIFDIKNITLFLNNIANEIIYEYENDFVYANFKMNDILKLDPIKNKIEITKKEQGYY